MSKFRIKTDEEQTSFYLYETSGIVVIGACKGQRDAIIARVNPVTGALSLSSCPEEVFMDLGIDYKLLENGSGYAWNVEE